MNRNKNFKKNNYKKNRMWLFPIIYIAAVVILTALLALSSFIPHNRLQKQFKESAKILCSKNVFFDLKEGVECSKIDRYADSILLNIAWHFDDSKPLKSIMWDYYYYTDYQNENYNLMDAVDGSEKAELQYMRYWHGSAAIVRALHLVFNIRQIYIVLGILLLILTICLWLIMLKQGLWQDMIVYIIGLISVGVWFVPFSLEYTWTFVCMTVTSIVVLSFLIKDKEGAVGIVFMLAGIITNYLDFLTTETITLSIPLLIAYRYKSKCKNTSLNSNVSNNIWLAKNIFCWGAGYVGMWLSKWFVAGVVLKQNVMQYVLTHIEERLVGEVDDMPIIKYLWLTLIRNIKCLFPSGYGNIGVVVSVLIVVAVIYVGYVYLN